MSGGTDKNLSLGVVLYDIGKAMILENGRGQCFPGSNRSATGGRGQYFLFMFECGRSNRPFPQIGIYISGREKVPPPQGGRIGQAMHDLYSMRRGEASACVISPLEECPLGESDDEHI